MKRKTLSKSKPRSLLTRLQLPATVAFGREKLDELVKVYEDLEKTLRGLKRTVKLSGSNPMMQINLRKLISQLSKSKRQIERKIGNTLMHERAHLLQRIGRFKDNHL